MEVAVNLLPLTPRSLVCSSNLHNFFFFSLHILRISIADVLIFLLHQDTIDTPEKSK